MVAKKELQELASILRINCNMFISVKQLCASLNNINKQYLSLLVTELQDDGFLIIHDEKRGYMLEQLTDIIDSELLKEKLQANFFGQNIEYVKTVDSTQVLAKLRLRENFEQIVVIANEQTKGKGQVNKNWFSPSGLGIWLSNGFHVKAELKQLPQLTLLTAVALVNTFAFFGVRAKIKWPNDCLVNGKKISGILAESYRNVNNSFSVIIGVGINVYQYKPQDFPEEIRNKAISLIQAHQGTYFPFTRSEIISQLFGNFERLYFDYVENGFTNIYYKWNNNAWGIDEQVLVETSGRKVLGVIKGINETGQLLLEEKINGVIHTISTGTIHL